MKNLLETLFNLMKNLIMKDKKTNNLLNHLEIIHKTCIDKAPTNITSDDTMQTLYVFGMYSIVVELTGDSYQAVKSRKELASHVMTRALLEAVVVLRNVINDPDHFYVRSQRSLAKGIKPLEYQLNNPDLIDTTKHSVEDVKKLLDKHNKLLDPKIKRVQILDDFKNAGMEYYYYTSYAFLCNYSHHDVSAILKRNIGVNVNPLDERRTQKITNLITHLILMASISLHELLETDQVDVFKDLQKKWQMIKDGIPSE
jgi:Family of unknown function (DUF5677)